MNDFSGVPGRVLVTVMVAGLVLGVVTVTDVDVSSLWAAVTEP